MENVPKKRLCDHGIFFQLETDCSSINQDNDFLQNMYADFYMPNGKSER